MKAKYLYIAAMAFLYSCSSSTPQEKADAQETESTEVSFTEAQLKTAGIVIGKPTRQVIQSELVVNGVVDVPPQNMVSVSFPMGGFLKSTQLMPGMPVNKGQVIAVMEDPALIQLQQDYLVAVSRLQYLQLEYDRQKELNESKVNADKVFQQIQSEFTSQRVMVKGLSEKVKLIGINPDKLSEATVSRSVPVYSPIHGYVTKVNVNIGKFVNPSDVLFELINPDDIHAALTVFEKDISQVKIGQKVKVSFADDATKEYDCEVILVTRNIDESRSGTLHCHFLSSPKQLLPGMFLNARIMVGKTDAITVPEDAVVRSGNKQYVVESITATKFQLLEVTTGVKENGFIAIESQGIEGKNLVIKSAYSVLSKLKNNSDE